MEHLLVANIVLQYRHISKTDLWPPAVFYSLPGFTWYSLQPPQGRSSVRFEADFGGCNRPSDRLFISINITLWRDFYGPFRGFSIHSGHAVDRPFSIGLQPKSNGRHRLLRPERFSLQGISPWGHHPHL